MKLRPAKLCCGCLSLLVGVEIICLINLLICVNDIAVASSIEPIQIAGVEISPEVQVFNAAWCMAGIPVIIGAGVGMLYRIESHLRIYFWYSLGTFFLNLVWGLSFVISGSICTSIVSRDVQRMGTAFVCGFTDTFVFFWMLMAIVVSVYCLYIIWSAAEETGRGTHPELLNYSAALKGAMMPLPEHGKSYVSHDERDQEKVPSLAGQKPAPMYGSIPQRSMYPSVQQIYGSRDAGSPFAAAGPPIGAPTSIGMPTSMGQPQSFVPFPASQAK